MTPNANSTGKPDRPSRGFLPAWGTFFLIWLGASASLEPARVIAGLIVTAGIARIATRHTTFWEGLDASPRRLGAGLRYLWVFLREMAKSNLNVLGYVYAPRVDITSELIQVPTRLTGPRERLALTNTLALTPGTLVINLEGDTLEMHVLDLDLVEGAREGGQHFETLLETAVG